MFDNISVTSWCLVLMVNETGVTVMTSDMSVNNKLYYINLCQVHLDNILFLFFVLVYFPLYTVIVSYRCLKTYSVEETIFVLSVIMICSPLQIHIIVFCFRSLMNYAKDTRCRMI
jgi:hypothetical protein